MENTPKSSPKEKVHKSGLPAPSTSQQPHHPPTIQPEIVEFDQDHSEIVQPDEFVNEPLALPPDEQSYERRS